MGQSLIFIKCLSSNRYILVCCFIMFTTMQPYIWIKTFTTIIDTYLYMFENVVSLKVIDFKEKTLALYCHCSLDPCRHLLHLETNIEHRTKTLTKIKLYKWSVSFRLIEVVNVNNTFYCIFFDFAPLNTNTCGRVLHITCTA